MSSAPSAGLRPFGHLDHGLEMAQEGNKGKQGARSPPGQQGIQKDRGRNGHQPCRRKLLGQLEAQGSPHRESNHDHRHAQVCKLKVSGPGLIKPVCKTGLDKVLEVCAVAWQTGGAGWDALDCQRLLQWGHFKWRSPEPVQKQARDRRRTWTAIVSGSSGVHCRSPGLEPRWKVYISGACGPF